jgi:hypothetical protein
MIVYVYQDSVFDGSLAVRRYILKKLRGKKRYFRNLWEEVNTCDLKLDNDSWFDFWHTHLDFFGVGENNLKIRREHIKAHVALYNRLLKQLEGFEKPYQTWICIHEQDPISDAVYVHTPNPNDNYFPHKIEELEWNCKLPNTFKDLIDPHKFDVAYYKSEYEEIYFIQSKEQGIRL